MIGNSGAAHQNDDEQRLQSDAADFTWMVARFANETAGVMDAIAVSSDGLLIALSRPHDPGTSERLAAVVSALTSLANSAADSYGLGALNQVIIDMESGYLVVARIGSGAVLGVVTSRDAKLSNIGYEMALFANRVGAKLSPQLIVELKNTVGGLTHPQRGPGVRG